MKNLYGLRYFRRQECDAVSAAGSRTRVEITLDGLIAIHAVRAVRMALGAVPGVVVAEVTMTGAALELEGVVDVLALRAVLASALDVVGVRIVTIRVLQRRILPLA